MALCIWVGACWATAMSASSFPVRRQNDCRGLPYVYMLKYPSKTKKKQQKKMRRYGVSVTKYARVTLDKECQDSTDRRRLSHHTHTRDTTGYIYILIFFLLFSFPLVAIPRTSATLNTSLCSFSPALFSVYYLPTETVGVLFIFFVFFYFFLKKRFRMTSGVRSTSFRLPLRY